MAGPLPTPYIPFATGPTGDDARAAIDALNQRAWEMRFSDAAEGAESPNGRTAAHAAGYARGEAYALRNRGFFRCLLLQHDRALADLEARRCCCGFSRRWTDA